MKILYLFILIIFFSLQSNTIIAQNVGAIQRGQRGYVPPPTQIPTNSYEKKMDVNLMVNEQLPAYAKALNLDAFQAEILKGMLVDHYDKREDVRTNYEIKFSDKQNMLLKIDEQLHSKLSEILSEEQIETFNTVKFLDEKELKKEKKKKKKRKKKNKEKGTH